MYRFNLQKKTIHENSRCRDHSINHAHMALVILTNAR